MALKCKHSVEAKVIKYHGTPIGGTKRDALLFLQGRHALVSYATPQHLSEVVNCCESFCLDNGAFTVWKSGKGTVNEQGYLNWVSKLRDHPAFDFFIIPDIIDGTEKENNEAVSRWKNERGGLPVFHLSESPSRLRWLAGKFPKVCLGSTSRWPAVGSKDWWPHMGRFMDTICKAGVPPLSVARSKDAEPCGIH